MSTPTRSVASNYLQALLDRGTWAVDVAGTSREPTRSSAEDGEERNEFRVPPRASDLVFF